MADQPAPLAVALQAQANARLCLFEVDRPEATAPQPIRRHVLDCYLRQESLIGGTNDTRLTDPGDVRFQGYLCRAALLPINTSNSFDWLASELAWGRAGFRVEAPLPWDPSLLGTVQTPCDGVIWLGDLAQLLPGGGLPNGGRAQFAGCLVLEVGARYGPGGIGLLTQPLLGEAIDLVLKPHTVLVLRRGDTLTLLAQRYGTSIQTLRRHNPQLASRRTIRTEAGDGLLLLAGRYGTTIETLRLLNPPLRAAAAELTAAGESLVLVAGRCETTVAVLRDYNPDYGRWPQHEPLPTGTELAVPAIRPSTVLEAGQELLIPGVLPTQELPAGEWIYLPPQRAAVISESWDTSEPPG